MTLPRLLSTTHNGFERELLSSARTERAPELVRAHVLMSVAQALACNGEGADAGTASSHEPGVDGCRRGRSSAWLLRGGLGMLALAAGVTLVLWQRLLASGTAAECAAAEYTVGEYTAEQAPSKPARALVETALPASALATAPRQALANTSTSTSRADRTPLPALAEAEVPDWLGAQLQLLGEARRELQVGSLERAERLLAGYGGRFPGGVVGPQVSALRSELRRRQAERVDQAMRADEHPHTASQ